MDFCLCPNGDGVVFEMFQAARIFDVGLRKAASKVVLLDILGCKPLFGIDDETVD